MSKEIAVLEDIVKNKKLNLAKFCKKHHVNSRRVYKKMDDHTRALLVKNGQAKGKQ